MIIHRLEKHVCLVGLNPDSGQSIRRAGIPDYAIVIDDNAVNDDASLIAIARRQAEG